MKKLLCLTLTLMLCLTLATSAALAETAMYATTQMVLDTLDEADFNYDYAVLNDDAGSEIIMVPMGSSENPIDIYLIFRDGESIGIRVWDIIAFEDADMVNVLMACNTLNADYKFVNFYVDTSDNTVTCKMDIIHRESNVGDIVFEATLRMANIIQDGFEVLSPYQR